MKIKYITSVLIIAVVALLINEIRSNKNQARRMLNERVSKYNEWTDKTVEMQEMVKRQFINHDSVFVIKPGNIKFNNREATKFLEIANYINSSFGVVLSVSCLTDGTSKTFAIYDCYLTFKSAIVVIPVIAKNLTEHENEYITEFNLRVLKAFKYGILNYISLPDSIAYDRCRYYRFMEFYESSVEYNDSIQLNQIEREKKLIEWLNDSDYVKYGNLNKSNSILKYRPLIIDSINYDSTYNSKSNNYILNKKIKK